MQSIVVPHHGRHRHDERRRLHRQDRHADLHARRDDEDSKKEANETFYLDLFGNSGNSLSTKNRGLGTILNDD